MSAQLSRSIGACLVAAGCFAIITSFTVAERVTALPRPLHAQPVCSVQSFKVPDPLTAAEREKAIALLQSSASGLSASIAGLTPAQLSFKPSADRWSIQECVQHIAASESLLWGMVEQALKQPVNPEKRSSIAVSDSALINAVEDRSKKNKTFEALEPQNSTFRTAADALTAFTSARTTHMDFVKTTDADLRNRVLELPIGTFDTYQFILLVGAHSQRHTQQIEEVKKSAGYPK